jgi:hypothetical protein
MRNNGRLLMKIDLGAPEFARAIAASHDSIHVKCSGGSGMPLLLIHGNSFFAGGLCAPVRIQPGAETLPDRA